MDGGAVPVFFILSGYLSANKLLDPNRSYRQLVFHRIQTLVVPFLFWNFLVLSLVWLLNSLELRFVLRSAGAYLNVGPTVWDNLAALLGIWRYPIVYQFWFLRDLIIITLLAPLVLKISSYIPFFSVLCLLVPSQIINSFGYYLLGVDFFRFRIKAFTDITKLQLLSYVIIWAVFGLIELNAAFKVPPPVVQLGSAACILFIARLLLHSSFGKRITTLASGTFFLYATHEPIESLLGKLWALSGAPMGDTTFSFLFIVTVTFLLCMGAYLLVSRFAPKALIVLTGGR